MFRLAKEQDDVAIRQFVLVCLTICVISSCSESVADDSEHKRIYRLPQDIAQRLREHNSPNQRGGCSESNIFIHGYRVLDSLHSHMWFLGAPDYLCETNSFVSVIVDSSGNWTVGENSDEDWRGSRNLEGIPVLFKHVSQFGFFLTSEWQIEGPGNLMYFSSSGKVWTPLQLPTATHKSSEIPCCDAPTIGSLCIAGSGNLYITYEESQEFDASLWRAPIDDAFPQAVVWSQVSELPNDAECDRVWPQNFMPSSLREKSNEGALFDVGIDWAVLIPGSTK